MAAGIDGLPSNVSTLAFFADVSKRESGILAFTSGASSEAAPMIFKSSHITPLESVGAGVWRTTLPLSKDEAGFNALFEVFCRFGFGVYL